MYLYDFSKMLLEHDLIHVVDSDLMKTFPNISEEIEQKLTAECGDDNIAKEQYYDFLLDRQFRVSVVTHKANKEKINISKDIRIVDLKEINLRGKYEKDKDGFYTIENNKIEDEEVNLILDILSENYPNTITIDELEKKVKERMKKETNNVYANAVYLMYGKLVEGYSNKLTVKKEEKINLNPKYKNYLNYFITNPNHAIALASYQGTINYDSINPVMLSIITLFDGTRTDEDIFNLLLEKEKAKEISITLEDGSTKEDVLKNNIEICRNFVEINLLNK